jgi:dihydrofolate reductase
MGSLTLCRSLLKAGLVDRFRVVVFPVITGSSGRERIYDGYPDVALEMISSRTFDGRIQLLEYVPAILAAGPQRGQRLTGTDRRVRVRLSNELGGAVG